MYTTKTITQVFDDQGNPVDVTALQSEIADFDAQIVNIQEFRKAAMDKLNKIQAVAPELVATAAQAINETQLP